MQVPLPCERWEDGKLVVAFDGACPYQDTDPELRRSAVQIYYGEDHPANDSWPVEDMVQGAQSAEVAGATRWAQWAWGPTKLLTDSQYVFERVTRILKYGAKVCKAPRFHRSMWYTFCSAVEGKGRHNFAVEKVASHVPWEQVKDKDEATIEKWIRNDAADKGAVAEAEKFKLSDAIYAAVKKEKKTARLLQAMMIAIINTRQMSIEESGWKRLDEKSEAKMLRMKRNGTWTDHGGSTRREVEGRVPEDESEQDVRLAVPAEQSHVESYDIDPAIEQYYRDGAYDPEDEIPRGYLEMEEEEDLWAGGGLDRDFDDPSVEKAQNPPLWGVEAEPEIRGDTDIIGDSEPEVMDIPTPEECKRNPSNYFPNYDWNSQREGVEGYTHFSTKHVINDEEITRWERTYSMSLLNAVVWYWTNLMWWPKATSKAECNDVTWIELLIDFQRATHTPLTRDGNDDDSETLLAKALRF